MIRIDRDRTGGMRVTFFLRPDTPRGRVSVVGDFNDWRPGAHELRPRSNGTRSVAVTVPEGTDVRFRYLGENGHWCNETEYPDVRQVGEDSVIRVVAPRRSQDDALTDASVPAPRPRTGRSSTGATARAPRPRTERASTGSPASDARSRTGRSSTG
ncbi:MAG TPA: hypothetical protein VD903_01845 [Pseudonocardia sp.]|nr:hypothetical protein [Pseudonocardia sp.]